MQNERQKLLKEAQVALRAAQDTTPEHRSHEALVSIAASLLVIATYNTSIN